MNYTSTYRSNKNKFSIKQHQKNEYKAQAKREYLPKKTLSNKGLLVKLY